MKFRTQIAFLIFVCGVFSALPLTIHADTQELYHGEYLYLDDQSNDWVGLPLPMVPQAAINSSINLVGAGSSFNPSLNVPAGFVLSNSSNGQAYTIQPGDISWAKDNGLISNTDIWMGLTSSDGYSFYASKQWIHPISLPLDIIFKDSQSGNVIGTTRMSESTSITKTNSKINSNTDVTNGKDIAQALDLSTLALPTGYELESQYSDSSLYSLDFQTSKTLMDENYLSQPQTLNNYMLTPQDVNVSQNAFNVTVPVKPIKHKITAYFKNIYGDNIAPPSQFVGAIGVNWTPQLPAVDGYTTPIPSSQVVKESDSIVTYIYTTNSSKHYNLTIVGEDSSGKELYQYTDKKSYRAGDSYNIYAPNIQGYDSMTISLDGSVSSVSSENRLIFIYTPNLSNTSATAVSNQYLNPDISNPISLEGTGQHGLLLDLTGHAYSVQTIEEFIDELSNKPNSYLQLNLTGNIYSDSNWNWINSGITMESSVLGQSGSGMIYSNGQWYIKSSSTGQPVCTSFPLLTKNDLRQIVAYGVAKGVQIIPTIDLPSHAQSLLSQESWSRNSKYYSQLLLPSTNKQVWQTLNYNNPIAVTFSEQVLSEYLTIFSAQPHRVFAIGGDEIVGSDNEQDADYPGFAQFMNQINRFLNTNGYISRMWNDAITPSNIGILDKNIQIAYWTTNGATNMNTTNPKTDIVSAQVLLDNGFKLFNYNGYFLYFGPTQNSLAPAAYAYTLNDLNNYWSISNFALNNLSDMVSRNTQNILGSSMSFWGNSGEEIYTDEQIYQNTRKLITSYLNSNN